MPFPMRRGKQAWKDHFAMWHRSMRAVKNSLPTPCRNSRPSLKARNSWSDSGYHFWKGVWRRGCKCGGGREMQLRREAWGVYLAGAGRSVEVGGSSYRSCKIASPTLESAIIRESRCLPFDRDFLQFRFLYAATQCTERPHCPPVLPLVYLG